MVVADRPGFAQSQPDGVVGSIADQADALHPGKVQALVLVSPFFGERGETAQRLTGLGGLVRPMLPRDLKNSIAEVRGQAAQLPAARAALKGLTVPVLVVHGDADDFVPVASARTIARDGGPAGRTQLVEVPGGDHFLNACCVPALLSAFEKAAALASSPPQPR